MSLIDLTGKRFGRLTVIKRDEDYIQASGRRRIMWLCNCDCGAVKSVMGDNLRSGKSTSCGCLTREEAARKNTTHHETDTNLYAIWSSMKGRCYNKNNTNYYRYGGRGITVCDEWRLHYEVFRDWMLANGFYENNHKTMTLDRIDNNRGYTPDNCRLVDAKAQANNRSRCRLYTYCGRTQNIMQWSEETGINYKKLHHRLSHGWDIERALASP